MMRWKKYGLALLFSMVMYSLYIIPCYAGEYVLDSGIIEDGPSVSAWSLETDSNSDIMLFSAYNDVYDGSISNTVVTYMKGIVARFSPSVHYVLFRESQYRYRLVYGKDLSVSGNVFTGTDCNYVYYDSRNYTVTEGYEGNFSLNVSSYTVYTDLPSMYPMLYEGVSGNVGKAALFCFVVMFLFDIIKAFFSNGRYSI